MKAEFKLLKKKKKHRINCSNQTTGHKYLCISVLNFWFMAFLKHSDATHLVVQENTDYGRHHTHDVGEGDRVAQHQQGDADDHDPLGGVGNSIAEWTDEVENTEGDNVLSKVAETTDEQQDQGSHPTRDF